MERHFKVDKVNADSKIIELQEQLERLTNHKKELFFFISNNVFY